MVLLPVLLALNSFVVFGEESHYDDDIVKNSDAYKECVRDYTVAGASEGFITGTLSTGGSPYGAAVGTGLGAYEGYKNGRENCYQETREEAITEWERNNSGWD